jgi:hypothetical protein
MKIFSAAGGFDEWAHFGIRAAGSFFLTGLVIGLVSVWVLTGAFCELGKWMAGSGRANQQIK